MKKVLLLALAGVVLNIGVRAQVDSDANQVYDRDIALIKENVYTVSDIIEPEGNDQVVVVPGTLEHLYIKINDLEKVIATLTSQVEELSHELSETKKELKSANAQMDTRLTELKKAQEDTKKQTQKNDKKEDKKVAEPTEKKDSTKSPKQTYDDAYALLNAQKYAQAQIALEDFLAQYPKDALAGNAQYWLGETFYVRELYEPAAVAFKKGFTTYKEGAKGADCLFKLGLTMEKLNKKKEACIAYKNLKKEFPKADESLVSRAAKQMSALGCEK